MRHTQLLQVSS